MAPKSTAPKKKDQAMTAAVSRQASREDRLTAIGHAMAAMNKNYGNGTIMRMGDIPRQDIRHISTGILSVDLATGIGGLPRGRIVEIYGPESSGKTTLALSAVAQAQKAGGDAAFIDAEHALDPLYAENLGVDIDSLLVSQPDDGEQALEIAEALIRSGAIDIIVIDSVAALVPKAEIEGEMGDSAVGMHARLMSKALRKLSGVVAKSNTILIFINQLREKVGVIYGNPEVTTGGRALKFYSSVRIDIRRVETLKVNGEMVGSHTRCKVVKNKIAPPFREAEFDIMYGEGISREGELLDLAVKAEVVQKAGAWFSYKSERLGQGRDKVKELLRTNPELAGRIETELWENIDKLYDRKKATKSKAKVTEVAEPEKDEKAEEKKPKKAVKIDAMVDD